MAQTVTAPELVHQLRHLLANGDLTDIKSLLEKNCISPNSVLAADDSSATILHWASLSNRISIARYLIDNGADVNFGESRANEIPLQWAVRDDRYTELVQLLLDSGSNVHHVCASGLDPLRIACRMNNVKMAYLLITHGANPNAIDEKGNTALHELFNSPENDVFCTDIQRLLMSLGADFLIQDANGNNILHQIAYFKTKNNRNKFTLGILKMKGGYKLLDQRNKAGLTPFQVCRVCNNYVMMRLLLDFYVHRYLPGIAPFVIIGLKTCLPFFALHWFGWSLEGLTVGVISYFALNFLSQATVASPACGFAWGTIFLTEATYYLYCKDNYGMDVHCIVVFFCVVTCYTLYKSMVTSCETLPCDADRKELARLLVDAGLQEYPPPTYTAATNTYVSNNDSGVIGDDASTGLVAGSLDLESGKSLSSKTKEIKEVKLCTTCLSNKADADTHCSTCNKCVVSIDHHCPFVNNCVGRGNRRVFVFFCLFASIGCICNAILAFWVLVSVNKGECTKALAPGTSEKGGPFEGSPLLTLEIAVANAVCGLMETPFLPLASLHTLITGCWILSLCIYQLTMVATATTTYQMIKGQRYFQRQPIGVIMSNLTEFFVTGKFRVIPYVGPKRQCCDGSNHSHAHAHTHTHGEASSQGYPETDPSSAHGQAHEPLLGASNGTDVSTGSYTDDAGLELGPVSVGKSVTPYDVESVGTGVTTQQSPDTSIHSDDQSDVRVRKSRSRSLTQDSVGTSTGASTGGSGLSGVSSGEYTGDPAEYDSESGVNMGLLGDARGKGNNNDSGSGSMGWMTSMLLSKSKGL